MSDQTDGGEFGLHTNWENCEGGLCCNEALAIMEALVAERDEAVDKLQSPDNHYERADRTEAEVARLKDICDTMTGPAKLQEARDEVDRWKRAYAEEKGLREGEEARGDYAEDQRDEARHSLSERDYVEGSHYREALVEVGKEREKANGWRACAEDANGNLFSARAEKAENEREAIREEAIKINKMLVGARNVIEELEADLRVARKHETIDAAQRSAPNTEETR